MTHTIIENDLKYYYSSEEIKNLAALSSGCRKTQLADYVVDLDNDSIIKSRATNQELIDIAAKTAKIKGTQHIEDILITKFDDRLVVEYYESQDAYENRKYTIHMQYEIVDGLMVFRCSPDFVDLLIEKINSSDNL